MKAIKGFGFGQTSSIHEVLIEFNQRRASKSGLRAGEGLHEGEGLRVIFDPRSSTVPVIRQVELISPTGVSPSDLRRFAWAKWLRVAEARYRMHGSVTADKRKRLATAQRDAMRAGGATVESRRPGRRGHGIDHYQAVADRYRTIVMDGHNDPTKRIAAEFGVSRNTAAGWVGGARQRQLLEPALRNRSG